MSLAFFCYFFETGTRKPDLFQAECVSSELDQYFCLNVNGNDCSSQISHEFAAFFLPFDVSYLLLVYIVLHTDICKIATLAAIYFMTTFILSEYYKLERGRFITTRKLPLFLKNFGSIRRYLTNI